MASRFMIKSFLGLVSLLAMLFALRDDIHDFCFLPPIVIAPVSVDALNPAVASPQDHIDLWLTVIDDHQEPLQRSQIDSSGNETSVASVTLNRDLEPFDSTYPELAEVWNASKSRRKIRTDSQRLLNELERLNPESDVKDAEDTPHLPSDFIFVDVWTKQRGLIEAERTLRAARLKSPENVVQLRKQMEDVRKLMKEVNQDQVAAHVEFLQLEEAEMRGYELRYLDALKSENLLEPLAERGFQVLADLAFEEACQQLTARIDLLKGYTATYALNGSHAEWVRHETVHCEQVRSFLEGMRDLDESRFDERIQLLGGLRAAEVVHETVRDLAVMGTHRICDKYLINVLPLDEVVLSMDDLGSNAKELPVHRSNITLVWEDKRLERLTDSKQDEFSLPQNRLRRVIIDGKGTRPAILKGTQKSEAVVAYNTLRGRVDWTVKSLQSLQEGCLAHSAFLGEVWPRIEEMNKLAAEFPQLFVGVQAR